MPGPHPIFMGIISSHLNSGSTSEPHGARRALERGCCTGHKTWERRLEAARSPGPATGGVTAAALKRIRAGSRLVRHSKMYGRVRLASYRIFPGQSPCVFPIRPVTMADTPAPCTRQRL